MKKPILIIILILAIPSQILSENNFKKILFLSSYSPSFPTYIHQVNGLREVFSDKNIILDIEFMDSKRYRSPEYFESFKNNLSYKLSNQSPYDILITADDNALNFCLENHKSLFHSTPIVFFGVNDIKQAVSLNNNPLVTGLIENTSMQETISLIKKLRPETKQIIVIVDNTKSGQADLKKLYYLFNSFPQIEFTELSLAEMTWDQFKTALHNIDDYSSALLLSAYSDINKETLLFNESIKIISDNINIPIFHLWYHGIGQGVLGGKVISHYEQAKAAARMALQILNGTSPVDIPIHSKENNEYIFDYEQLEKFSISKILLPESSIIINKPCNFYEENKLIIWVTISFILFLIFCLLLALFNIRRRKKIETALSNSEQKYKSIFNNSASVMLLINPANMLIEDANEAAAQYYGYSLDQFKNMPIETISGSEKEKIKENINNVLLGRKDIFYLKHILSNSDERDVEVYSGLIIIEDTNYIYSIIHDVTEKNEYYKNMEIARHKAEEASRIKSDFLANISHELRTPLNGLLGMLELCQAAAFSTEETEWFRLARVSADNLRVIIEDLLDYTQINTGKLSINKSFFLLKNLVDIVSDSFNQQLASKDLSFEISGRHNSKKFYGDETRITQIIHNLVSNSIEYSESGKVIVELNEKQDCLEIIIKDEGIGIQKKNLKNIFQPFEQLENPYIKTHRGMGLGLAIVKNLVELQEGKINVESELGTGTTISVEIPGEFQ